MLSLLRRLSGALVFFLCLSGPGVQAQEKPLQVVATFSILADMAREVGGDAVAVHSLVPPGADSHVYEPTPADLRRLAAADLVVVNGLRFEGWIDRLIKASGYRGPVVVASKGVTPRRLEGAADPHAWQSLANARQYVGNLRAALVAAAPARAGEIEARAQDYLRRIDALDASIKARFSAIPQAARRVVTSHDAFGYFAAAYGVEFFHVQGWTTENDASAADIARIVRQVKARQARALFLENISDPRLVQRIAREAGVPVGGTLYSDALSAPGTGADSYLKMMEHNAATLVAALR